MAGRIAGITIEIGGDTTNLQKSLKGVDAQLKSTQNNLKDIDKLLKLDPGNVELLTQKQKNLESAIGLTKERLEQLKTAQSGLKEGTAEWDAVQRETIATEQSLKSLEQQYREFGSVATQQIKAVGKEMQDAGKKVSDFGQKLAPISGAAGAIGGALLKLGYDAVTGADDLNTLAKQTGFSTEELQKMQYAADLIDVSVDDMTGALRKLKTQIDPNNESLAALGVSVTNADGTLRDANDVFYDTILALSQIPNETERDRVSMEIFGKSADSLAGVIDDGGAALREFGQEAEGLGIILDQDTIDSLNDTNDTIDKVKMNLSGTMAKIGADVGTILAPALEKGADLIGEITDKLRQLTPEQQETILKVVGIVAAVAPMLIVGGKIISGLGTLVSVIGTVVGVLGGPLTLAIGAVVAAGVLLWKNWDTIKEKASELKDWLSGVVENIKWKFDELLGKIQWIGSQVWNAIVSPFITARDWISGVIQSIRDLFSFEWTLPHIKLPHFSWSWFSVGGLVNLPSLSIQWYRKAYDNPVMFTSPTVMQTPQGAKGFGDGHGAEIVMGLDKLRELVGTERGGVEITIVQQPWQNSKELAMEVKNVLVADQRQREAASAYA